MQSIREIRESKRMSQVEVAKRLGIDTQNYHRLEKRGKKLTIEQLENIANALETSIFFILIDDEQKQQAEQNLRIDEETSEQKKQLIEFGKKIDELRKSQELLREKYELIKLKVLNK